VRVNVYAHDTGGLYGWVHCPADGTRSGSDPDESCFRQWAKIDTVSTAGVINTTHTRKSLACHEMAHTVGSPAHDGQQPRRLAGYVYRSIGIIHESVRPAVVAASARLGSHKCRISVGTISVRVHSLPPG
jgi:hypothetical protein